MIEGKGEAEETEGEAEGGEGGEVRLATLRHKHARKHARKHANAYRHARAHTRARTHPVIDHFFIKQISFYAMILMFDSDFRIIIGSYTRDLSFEMFCSLRLSAFT